MSYISAFSIPVFIFFTIMYGYFKRVNVYDCFICGAKDGIYAIVNIIPSIVALMIAISMFRASGAIQIISSFLSPLLSKIGFPTEVLPLAILRPVSGSASLAIVTDIFKTYGPDSYIGKVASVMMGSTETTFYTIAVYFGAIKIKNTRHTLKAALSADFTGIVLSAVLVKLILGG